GDPDEAMIAERLDIEAGGVRAGDVVVVTRKIVSKAEGQLGEVATVPPSPLPAAWARRSGKGARQVETVRRESRRVVRMDRGHIISETRHGLVCANAGVDASNTARDTVSLLPRDPDASAERIRKRIAAGLDPDAARRVGVVVTDSFGRP